MNTKSLKDVSIRGKKVIIRVDFNVPIKDGIVQDTKRIRAALETINALRTSGADKIILLSHLSRIKAEEDKAKKSLKPVAAKLEELSKLKVIFVPATRGAEVEKAISTSPSGSIIMLENTRFEDVKNGEVVKYESKNNPELGKYWANLADVFVNDAFGTAHRSHASNVGIAQNIKESCVGLLVENELKMLTKAVVNPAKPVVAIIGGSKVSDKIGVIDAFAKSADTIIIVGGMAYTFLKSQGIKIGKSLVEDDKIELASQYLKKMGSKIVLPIDHVVAKEFANVKGKITVDIADDEIALDIGPKSVDLIKSKLSGAKTVIWNGPAGVFEFDNFAKGTEGICAAIANLKGVYSIIGGGDSAAAAIKLGFESKFSHISTGGGASLEFFEGKTLPGIAAIQTK